VNNIAYEREIDELRAALVDARRENAVIEMRAAVAEWAVVGVVRSNIQLKIAEPGPINQANLDFIKHVGTYCANEFLHKAGLAFTAYAEFNAMRSQLIGLGGDLVPSRIAMKDWPKPFTGPFE